jgi:hypothetical protein
MIVWVLSLKNKHRHGLGWYVAEVYSSEEAAMRDVPLYPANSWETAIIPHKVMD